MERSKELGYDIKLLFSNTDGFMVDIDERFYDECIVLINKLIEITGIDLEYEECKEMYQRDVNNFLLIKADGSVKLKGAYEIDKEFHKNHSNRIVSIAAANYFINDIKPETTITNHLKRNKLGKFVNDTYEIYYSKKYNKKVVNHGIYDFMSLKKIDERFRFWEISKNKKFKLQKSIRYIMTKTGSKILKETVESGKMSLVEATKTSYEQIYNDMPNCDINSKEMIAFEQSIPINYNHYIKEAYKLIHAIEGYGQTTLF